MGNGSCKCLDAGNEEDSGSIANELEQEQILSKKNNDNNNTNLDDKKTNEIVPPKASKQYDAVANEQEQEPIVSKKNNDKNNHNLDHEKQNEPRLSRPYTILAALSKSDLSSDAFNDFDIFKNNNIDEKTMDPCTIEECKKTQRLITGLKFYTMLNFEKDSDAQDKFDEFMRETYKEILNDNMHFTEFHNNDLEIINNMLIESKAFEACDITNCRFTDKMSTHVNHSNTKHDFYKQTMDSLHFYVFHQYDTGFKTTAKSVSDKDVNDEKEEDDITDFVDKELKDMTDAIESKKNNQKNMTDFGRQKDKFNIHTLDTTNDTTTYTDGLFIHLHGRKFVEAVDIAKFEAFIKQEEYDTDTLQYDMQITPGNVATEMKEESKDSEQIMAETTIFIRTASSSTSSFSVGLRFYYWPFYEGRRMMPLKEQRAFNQNDHSGYKMNQLFMKKKYDTFKEEISYYEHLDWNDYLELVVKKAKTYEGTNRVKETLSAKGVAPFERLHYDIPEGTVLGFENLVSLILYTDFSALCTDFSSTFRKTAQFETIQSIKARNREYYWMSRILRETVECFGRRGCGDWDGINEPKWKPENRSNFLSGPFYCGMGCEMIMPEFNLRLCSPTSTSIAVQIAVNFSGTQGIIIQLNNDRKPCDLVRGFNCSWISRFAHEEERLFFGGFFRIRIEGVRLRKSNENFADFFQPLYYLDALITGTRDTHTLKITKGKRRLIESLIKWKKTQEIPLLKGEKLHEYILQTFDCFCSSKKQISLDLFPLGKANKDMVALVMNDIETGMKDRPDDDIMNLFRRDIFEVFNNVKTIEMDTFSRDSSYSISLIGLLSLIKSKTLHLEKVIIKAPIDKETKNSWLSKLWSTNNNNHLISTQYEEHHYKVSVKRVSKGFCDEDWFIIQKMGVNEETSNAKKKKPADKDLKIELSMDTKLGESLKALPRYGVIEYEAPNKFWSIQMPKEWQEIRKEFSKMTDELYCDTDWYKEGIERGKKWANVLHEENAEIITRPPTSLSGAHVTLGRVDKNSKECPECFVEGKHVEFDIDRLVCHPPFRDIPKNLPGQEQENGYRYYSTFWVALGVKFIDFPHKTRFPPHISLCNIAVKLKIKDVDDYENIRANPDYFAENK